MSGVKQNESKLRPFLYSSLKIAAAILIVGLVLALIGGVIGGFMYYQEQRQHATLAEPKQWESITASSLDSSQFRLSTMWKDAEVFYHFRVTGYGQKIARARALERSGDHDSLPGTFKRSFTIQFMDANGFKLDQHVIPLSSMTQVVDSKGISTKLSVKESFYMDDDTYAEVSSWNIIWSL